MHQNHSYPHLYTLCVTLFGADTQLVCSLLKKLFNIYKWKSAKGFDPNVLPNGRPSAVFALCMELHPEAAPAHRNTVPTL